MSQKKIKVEEEQVTDEEARQEESTERTKKLSLDDACDRSPQEKVIPNLDGETRKIKDVELHRINSLRDTQKGTARYYPVTVKLLLDDEDNNFLNINGFRQYVDEEGNTGKVTFWRAGENAASRLFDAYCVSEEVEDREGFSDKDFLQGLIGKKVKIKHETRSFGGEYYEKNCFDCFID